MVYKDIFKDLQELRSYNIKVSMGFATIYGPDEGSTCIMDANLLKLLIGLGVPCTYVQPNAGLTLKEVGHEPY